MTRYHAKLLALGIVASGWFSGAALGQNGRDPANKATSGAPVQEGRQSIPRPLHNDSAHEAAAGMRRHGSSLMRATMQARSDPGQARLADVSFMAVPEPIPRTLRKHDQVTIIVREESEFRSKGTTKTKKKDAFEAQLEEFVRLKIRNAEIEGGALGARPPSIKLGGSRDFKGEGQVDRSDRFTTRVQAEVLDVKPNGTLVLQARSRIRTDDEERFFILTGVCRVEDVSADNTILSSQLYDKHLEQNSKGNVRNATRKGWLGNLLDVISPF